MQSFLFAMHSALYVSTPRTLCLHPPRPYVFATNTLCLRAKHPMFFPLPFTA